MRRISATLSAVFFAAANATLFCAVYSGAAGFGPPVAARAFVHHRLQRLASIGYPDASDESWSYDDLGNRTVWNRRSGVDVTYADNALNQYSSITGVPSGASGG